MIKILLSVAGVFCIGLGLFGGNVLKGFVGSKDEHSEPMVKVEVPASTEAATTREVAQNINRSTDSETQMLKVAPVSEAVESETVEVEQQVAEVTPAAPAVPAASALEEVTDTVASATDSISEDGAEPIAPAQAAGDLIAMAEQAKSSSRNEQVNIASTVLSSNEEPVVVETASIAAAALDKSAEVESVIVSTTGGTDADGLIVVKNRVNLREGPSIDHPIVLTMDQGQELMEFKRVGNWVNVGAYGTSGKIGWVHQRLVGPAE